MLACALALHAPPAHGADATDIHAKIAQKKEAQAELSVKAKKINKQVTSLQARLVSTTRALRTLEDGLSDTDQKLKTLQNQKAACIARLYEDQKALGGFVSAAQKYGRSSTPDILVKEKPLDAARASLIMKSMIPTLNAHEASVKSAFDTLSTLESTITVQRKKQVKELSKIKIQQAELDKLLQQRKSLYQQTESDRKQQEADVAKLAKEARTLEDLVARMRPKHPDRTANLSDDDARDTISGTAASLPAGSILPVAGTVHTGFGQTDDIGGKSMGITFNALPGATVVTPLAGVVRFAGPFQKYKQILIVEHRGGYHSLIAGLGRIDTVVGAKLAAGEPVGVAPSSSDAHIYYELRQNGSPVNPRKIIVAQRKQDKS